jgi:uncharacterized protein
MNIVNKIKKFVESECKKPTSKYGAEPFDYHFAPVVKYALDLAEELGADKEIVTLAGWLHDIGSIMDGRGEHHITGAKIAERKLKELGYPAEKIERVKKCILNHRGSMNRQRLSLEEKILVEADAMSAFDNISGIFKAALVYEKMTQGEAKESVKRKLQNKYKQLHFKESIELIKPKYEAAMLLLNADVAKNKPE